MFLRILSGLIRSDDPVSTFSIPAVSTAAVITIGANAVRGTLLCEVGWSYNADPSTGFITVEDGSGNVIRKWYITKGGPGRMKLLYIKGSIATQMIITLAAVAGVNGTLDVTYLQ